MPELSLYNIDQISYDVRRQEIIFSHLPDDLIDHVCCDVEQEMQNGFEFSEAYRRVKQKMGSRRFKEIQEETLYAVDTKYRQMKNTMKISGITGTIMLGFAAIFKVMHWPGASVLMFVGAVTLALIFMPTALWVLWKETQSRKRIFLFITGFLAGAFLILGTMFKVQHWLGADIILTIGAISGILLFIPVLTSDLIRHHENKSKRPVYILGAIGAICFIAGMLFKIQHLPIASFLMVTGMIILYVIVFPWYTVIAWKEESHVSASFIFLVVGSLALIIPSAMVSLNIQRSYDSGYYNTHNQEKAVYNYLNTQNKFYLTQYHDSSFYPVVEQLHSKTNDLIKLINGIELKMVAESEGKPGKPVENPGQIIQTENGQEINFETLSNPFHQAPVIDFLLPGTAARMELETAITGYKNFLSAILPPSQFLNLNKMLDPATSLPGKAPEEDMFMLSGLHSLALLKNSLLATESYVMSSITKH